MNKIAIIMGSASDASLAKEALAVCREFGVPATLRVLSAHRSPEETAAFAKGAAEEGYGAIIAIAGKAAHLAGVVASQTFLPVIGVPVRSGDLGGLDALLSTAQMPKGVPVACVAIDGAANAALLAIRILALSDEALTQQLNQYMRALAAKTTAANAALQKEIEAL
ncbi:MAG: 5-(carboxyamino)imidazole ribonucleotide mutase [Eubacteriales bacterium]|nr:5-(carboxyamino)imidazole ribonucleotide mutase [Eubacteriales bacterium]